MNEKKDLLGIESLPTEQMLEILDMASSFEDLSQNKKLATLGGKTVINLFFEASTRTRTSFEVANWA